MNRIDSHRRVDEGVFVGNCRMNHLLSFSFCGWIGTACVDLLNSGLQHAFDRFSVAWDQAGMKISAKNWCIVSLKTAKAVSSARERKFTAAGGDVQVPWGGIHEWGSRNKGFNIRIIKANAVLRRGGSNQSVQGGDFSNIWDSNLITGSLLQERWRILHNTAVTKQWKTKWAYIFEL